MALAGVAGAAQDENVSKALARSPGRESEVNKKAPPADRAAQDEDGCDIPARSPGLRRTTMIGLMERSRKGKCDGEDREIGVTSDPGRKLGEIKKSAREKWL